MHARRSLLPFCAIPAWCARWPRRAWSGGTTTSSRLITAMANPLLRWGFTSAARRKCGRKIEIHGVESRRLAQEEGPEFPQGRIRKIGELVVPHVPAYELAEMVVEAFIKPDENGQRRRIVAAYLDPANFKDIGDGHTIADQLNEVFDPWEITCERASNDRLGGWQLLYRMLRTGEFEITDVCPRSFEALRTRMHDDARPGDIRKIAGDPLDDVADETRYALYTFVQQATTPRELVLQQAVRGLDVGSAAIRWQQKSEELDREEAPIKTTMRLGLGRRWRQR